MPTTSVSSREFNQDTGGAKRAALQGPVFITDRGKPSYVLMTFDEFRRMTGKQPNITELLSMPADDTIEFEPQKIAVAAQIPDLS